jgi:hypothetical protein
MRGISGVGESSRAEFGCTCVWEESYFAAFSGVWAWVALQVMRLARQGMA